MNPKTTNARVTPRAFLLALTAGLIFTMLAATDTVAQSDHCADVNGDQAVTTVDALMVLRRAVGTPIDFSCPDPQSAVLGTGSMEAGGCGDVNGDGNTSTVDALIILNYAIGISVELQCASGTQARNLVRYLNFLVCKDKEFRSTATEMPSGQKWQSFSGVESEYQEWNDEMIGEKFVVTIGKCGNVELFGPIPLPAGSRILMRLELGGIFNNAVLRFYDEGPIGGALKSGDEAEPFAVLTGVSSAAHLLGSAE